MKLKQFIDNLEQIRKEHGDDISVTMADFLSVVDPVYFNDEYIGETVIITDRKGVD